MIVLVSLIVLLRFPLFFAWCIPTSPFIQLNDFCTCVCIQVYEPLLQCYALIMRYMYIYIYYVAMVTTGFNRHLLKIQHVKHITYKPSPIDVYVSYVYTCLCSEDVSLEPLALGKYNKYTPHKQVFICTYTPLGHGLYTTYSYMSV